MSEHICPAGVADPHVTERTYERVPGEIEVHCYCADCGSGWFQSVAVADLPAPPPEPLIVVAPDAETDEG